MIFSGEDVTRIMAGINKAYKDAVREKALLGQDVVTTDENGNIRIESARANYERVFQD